MKSRQDSKARTWRQACFLAHTTGPPAKELTEQSKRYSRNRRGYCLLAHRYSFVQLAFCSVHYLLREQCHPEWAGLPHVNQQLRQHLIDRSLEQSQLGNSSIEAFFSCVQTLSSWQWNFTRSNRLPFKQLRLQHHCLEMIPYAHLGFLLSFQFWNWTHLLFLIAISPCLQPNIFLRKDPYLSHFTVLLFSVLSIKFF